MGVQSRILVFGDQTQSYHEALQELLLIRNNEVLRRFLDDSFDVVQNEIACLPALERKAFPWAESLGLLLVAYCKRRQHPALDGALTCIYHIASYLRMAQTADSASDASYLLGLCSGSLAATAISCASGPHQVVRLGSKAVLAAFRIGMVTMRRALTMTDLEDERESWSLVCGINEHEAEKLLAVFNEKQSSSVTRPYISTVSIHGITISGPPEALENLTSSKDFAAVRTTKVRVFSPYHAPHLYSTSDIRAILQVFSEDLNDQKTRIPIISSATGQVIESCGFLELLHTMVNEILLCQMHLGRLSGGIADILDNDRTAVYSMTCIGSHFASSLVHGLNQKGFENIVLSGSETSSGDDCGSKHQDSTKIAIIGFSGRFPEADGLAEFWELLQQGLDVHKPVPSDRFDANHYDPAGRRRNTSKVHHGCWIREPGLFDAKFFQMSPREACQADPAQRLALLTAYEAIEMAGIVPDRTASTQKHRVGVFFGTTSDDWREVNSGQNIDTYFIPGGNRAFVPGRINYHFKFSGPSISIDTACSSSLAAINLACNSLLKKDCDTAIAGGTNIMTNPDNFAGLDRGHFLSQTGNCKTFDDSADGYCRADGVGTVIMKRLPDAIADNDPVFGVILGAHTNHSAEAVSITRPLATAQEYLFQKLLNESGVHAHDVSYIEMHGTGTQAGDAVEMQSVLNSFAWDQSRRLDQTLYLGSVKSNVGHGESASGVTALIKVLLMMQHDTIPRHSGIKGNINHGFPLDLAQRNVHIASCGVDWKNPAGRRRRAFVNNFSAAGGNTALLLEDYPPRQSREPEDSDPRKHHVITVSAKSPKSLQQRLVHLAEYAARQIGDDVLAKMSYTTTVRRIHHSHRVAIVASDLPMLAAELKEQATRTVVPTTSKAPSVAFLFTGQGASSTAMGRELYKSFSSLRADIDHMDNIAITQGFASVVALIDGSQPIESLSPVQIQLGICMFQIALARFWTSLGVVPSYVLGHSLGEYAALAIAQVLSINDAIYLCGQRAALIERYCIQGTHCMLAVEASQSDLMDLIVGTRVEVACINGSTSTVLSGELADIDQICSKLSGVRYTRLAVPYAFHSAQVDPILDELEKAASNVVFRKPVLPIVSSVTGEVITKAGMITPHYIRQHCRGKVNFQAAVEASRRDKLLDPNAISVEIGPRPILSKMVSAILRADCKCYPSLRPKEDAFRTIASTLSCLYLAGLTVDWDEYHRDFRASHEVISLPTYSWDLENYWISYRGNWCLTRGEAQEPTDVAPTPRAPVRLSSSIHDVLEEVSNQDQASIIAKSDLHDPDLLPVAQGHQVNGLIMCPSSLYADVAHTLGKRLITHRPAFQDYGIDVRDMAVERALIVAPTGPQYFHSSMTIDWTTQVGTMKIYSIDDSERTVVHASCRLELHACESWLQEWSRYSYLINRSIAGLHRGVGAGICHRVQRGLAYKLFSSLVHYGPDYQGMHMVTFDSLGLEATAEVRLQPVKGHFVRNPFWIDSFGHLTGFVMNATDSLGSGDHVFVNHGWQSMRCSETFSPDVVYQTYVKMQMIGKPQEMTYSGDVFVMRDEAIIAVYGSVTFRAVPRRVLEMLLPAPKQPKLPGKLDIEVPRVPGEPPVVGKLTRSRSQVGAVSKVVHENAAMTALLDAIVQAIGVTIDQLTDDTDFADLGLDSLMSLTILGKVREDLSLDLPSTLFEDCCTVRSLKNYFTENFIPDMSDDSDGGSSSSDEIYTAVTTPDVLPLDACRTAKVSNAEADVESVVAIIAKEIGISRKELAAAQAFDELGFDSLMSLNVLATLREKQDLDLAPDFFMQNNNLATVRQAFSEAQRLESFTEAPIHPPATSVLLQGSRNSKKTLFLFPDGSGSATSYLTLPEVSPDVRVYGLNCPYLKTPNRLTCSLQDLTGTYLAEIRRRQPRGPYSLGGWSAGGIAAYDAAQALSNQGERVERLILLDSPNPIGLSKLPPHFYGYLEKVGVFGDGSGRKPPVWLIQHFLSFIDALDLYKPAPFMPAHKTPATTLIWAKDGVCKDPSVPSPEPHADDTREMAWLLEDRTDLGANGWDSLLPEGKMTIEVVNDANHFTLVKGPASVSTATAMRTAMLSSRVSI